MSSITIEYCDKHKDSFFPALESMGCEECKILEEEYNRKKEYNRIKECQNERK
jgi:hypothetical protein|tara:strand:- start:538 stop:696 length:159 start_codon:yes stop_codon:yes gene_type:complete